MNICLPNANIDLYPSFLPYAESYRIASALEEEIEWQQDAMPMFGRIVAIPRLQAWFGDNQQAYSYSNMQLLTMPLTSTLSMLMTQVSEHCQVQFNSVLANYYRNERDSVGWHSDDEPELGRNPIIASLSFGQMRKFKLKHKVSGEKYEITLQSGDLLVMSGEMQHYWQHAILKASTKQQARISLTFRQIK